MGMRLRRPCEHGRYDQHMNSGTVAWCPGGEFLADDTLVIEKVDGEWPGWSALMITAVTPWFNSALLDENVGPIVLDALYAHQTGKGPL